MQQDCNLDAIASLVFILEEDQKGTLTSLSVAEAAKATSLFLENEAEKGHQGPQ